MCSSIDRYQIEVCDGVRYVHYDGYSADDGQPSAEEPDATYMWVEGTWCLVPVGDGGKALEDRVSAAFESSTQYCADLTRGEHDELLHGWMAGSVELPLAAVGPSTPEGSYWYRTTYA